MPDPAADRGVHVPAQLLARVLKVFASPRGQPRARRATDLVLLVGALVGLGAMVIAYPPSGFELALQRFLASIPGLARPHPASSPISPGRSRSCSSSLPSPDYKRFGARVTAAVFLGALVGVERRAGGSSLRRTLGFVVGALVIGLTIATLKWFVAK